MDQAQLLATLLDDLDVEVTFVDVQHIIRYMNKAATRHYSKYGDLVGKSIFSCHNEESSQQIIDIFSQLQSGTKEALYSANEKRRIYMRAVRDDSGTMIGYYERYTPPQQ